MRRHWFGLLVLVFSCSTLHSADEYRTVETAIKARMESPTEPGTVAVPGFLGIHVQSDEHGQLVVEDVQASSPAQSAGVQPKDRVTRLDGQEVATADSFRERLRTRAPGVDVKLGLIREGKPLELTARLAPVSRPMPAGRGQPSSLGVQVAATKGGEGVTIESVQPGSLADRTKLKVGETILKIDDASVNDPEKLREVIAGKKPDDTVTLTLLLAEKHVEMKVKLEPDRRGGGRFGGGWNRSRYWTKPVYKIAIILVEYPDTKHNEKIPARAWEEAMFSQGRKYTKSATGQEAHGSMYDYYLEQSYGKLKIEGKAFDYVQVSRKRAEYGTPGSGPRTALLTEAMDKILEREGKDALKDFDGVFFIYAGGRMQVARGSLYWPHRSNVQHKGKTWPYFICPEGGERMGNISVFCHEFGHMLGMPDLYARPENPGMEGVGIWCAMANQAGNGRPQHFSAWCKEKLEWIKPAVISPAVKQKLVLAPINSSPTECFKVLLKPDGSEYFLLENRQQVGFDKSLPSAGLLIWRVVGNRPILEESHGVAGPNGPRAFMDMVPFPSPANDAFTPFTTPSSRSQLGGGLPVHITNIERRPDGRVTFHIGYEYQ